MDELKLIKLACKGDPEAFGKLMLTLKDQSYRIAYCYLHNEHDSMDAVCNAMEKAFKNIKQLHQETYFKTWFLKIVINESKQLLRTKSRVTECSVEYIENIAMSPNCTNNLDIEELLSLVAPNERSMIYMKYYLGYSLEEISNLTEMPLSTVKSKIYRNLKQMKKYIIQKEALL